MICLVDDSAHILVIRIHKIPAQPRGVFFQYIDFLKRK